jgi:hypothetical protein
VVVRGPAGDNLYVQAPTISEVLFNRLQESDFPITRTCQPVPGSLRQSKVPAPQCLQQQISVVLAHSRRGHGTLQAGINPHYTTKAIGMRVLFDTFWRGGCSSSYAENTAFAFGQLFLQIQSVATESVFRSPNPSHASVADSAGVVRVESNPVLFLCTSGFPRQ